MNSPFKLDRRTKIVATLGPSSSDEKMIQKLVNTGVNVFRLNFSHGTHEEQQKLHTTIRKVESDIGRPIGILLDLQGPKLRISTFVENRITLQKGQKFSFYLEPREGDINGVTLPHKEIFDVLRSGHELLVDDGKIRLRVLETNNSCLLTEVIVAGVISDRKGVNVPDTQLPISALTEKDRKDLAFGLDLGIDWVALSFVQRSEDVLEAHKLVQGRAGILSKLEKPSILEELDQIIESSDAVMVARGDLGVELPPERVPAIQKLIIDMSRQKGKPVIVATQMLESMITTPIPTRAEASDVATAIYDGADAVMLSAETAAGEYPQESVEVMGRIISETEQDEYYRKLLKVYSMDAETTDEEAMARAASQVATNRRCSAIVTFSSSGLTTLRAARVRGEVPILGLTPHVHVARKLALVWGVYSVPTSYISSFDEMVDLSNDLVKRYGFSNPGDKVVITAGVPFGTDKSTNIIHLIEVSES